MKNKLLLVGGTALVILIAFLVGVKMYKGNKANEAEKIFEGNQNSLIPTDAPRMGAENPKVYLVEFLDPECESCRSFSPIVKMLLKEFEGKVQLVIRYAPFHPNSRFAIKILEASRKQGKYWETLDVIFQYQPEWGSHHHPQPELLWKYLPEAGLDLEKLRSDMVDTSIDALIEREIKDGQTLGVRRTPQFFVNGKPLEDFGVEPLRELIRKELQ